MRIGVQGLLLDWKRSENAGHVIGFQAEGAKGPMTNRIHLERLPRTIWLERSAPAPDAPEGLPLVAMLDQTKLPLEESLIRTSDWREVVDAVKRLAVRGAPALGIAGAAAVSLSAAELARELDARGAAGAGAAAGAPASYAEQRAARDEFWSRLQESARVIGQARPTAVNLSRGVEGVMSAARDLLFGEADMNLGAIDQAVASLFRFTELLAQLDEETNRRIGENGAALLPEGARVLTHCNAGSLATAFYGTALGVVYAAAEQGKIERVFADETRPVGQGSRLTAWELSRAGVPVTLICDNMAASLMAAGRVDAVVVGADRITANGDVANKIGTYGVAVLAAHHGIPFYVAAPSTTIDFSMRTGSEIPIEQRDAGEVLPHPIEGVEVYNPAFDVTPANLVSKIITERGVIDPGGLAAAYDKAQGKA